MTDSCIVVLCTAPSPEEGEKIAAMLVENKAAACCSLIPGLISIYRWQGQVQKDKEVLLVIKSTPDKFPEIERQIREVHSYEVPEIIALPVQTGSLPYLHWITSSLTG